MDAEEITREVREPLAAALGVADVAISGVGRLTGGAVHQTWSLDAALPDGTARRLVLRAFLPFGPQGITAREEFTVLRAAAEAGVPAPRPLLLLEHGLSYPSYLMERIDGETIGRRIIKEPSLAAARSVLTEQLAATLAQLHRVPLTAEVRSVLRAPTAGASAAAWELRLIEETYRTLNRDPHPAFELGFRWLAQHAVEPVPPALLHGDFRVGNLVVGPEGLRSVLDWEGAHIGDPAEDLAWYCVRSWRFGANELPAGGLGTREQLLAAYERGGGDAIGLERLRWWEIYGNVRWGVTILTIAHPFLTGETREVEPGAIGRRFAETEMELLDLLEGRG
jgi:aminoglycoside phosphotransferase (APT) family kinase protein